MGCKHKKMNFGYGYGKGDAVIKMDKLAKEGNKSVKGLASKCVAVKKKGCRK